MGQFTEQGFQSPVLSARINGDADDYLSVNCTFEHMRRQSEAAQKLVAPLLNGIRTIANERDLDYEKFCTAIGKYKIRELLYLIQTPEVVINQIDEEMKTIPNQR